MKPFLKSNAISNDAAKLRRRAKRDGYLFFRGLLSEKAVHRVRRDFAGILQGHGWLDDAPPTFDLVSSSEGFIEGSKESLPVFCEFQRMESFHSLGHSSAIIRVLDKLFGEQTFVHPQKIGRISFPGKSNFTTPAHQDFVHIQGTEDCWTAWIRPSWIPGIGAAQLAASTWSGIGRGRREHRRWGVAKQQLSRR